MKKLLSVFLCAVVLVFSFSLNVIAADDNIVSPVIDFNLTSASDIITTAEGAQIRATGLITSTALSISKSGTTLTIVGKTLCIGEVVKSGFKNLTVERRKTSSDSWKDYYDYGNKYIDGFAANLSTSLTVESGYQYRVTTKHYAKKNILMVQTISNESNIAQF